MTWTSHGHRIPGRPGVMTERPPQAHCGRLHICSTCKNETSTHIRQLALKIRTDRLKTNSTEVSMANVVRPLPPDNLSFQDRARVMVMDWANAHLDVTDSKRIQLSDVYVVWFCKTLQNWKALLSTTLTDGMYYEVTFDGDNNKAYLDAYKKFDNVTFVSH